MVRESDTAVSGASASMTRTPGMLVAPPATLSADTYDTAMDQMVQPPLRTQSGDNFEEPTAENYLLTNATVPPFIKNNHRRATQLERNAFCRFMGSMGLYYADKHRSWIMGCSAFISFACLLLMILVLIPCTTSPELLFGFHWVKGEAHWQLMMPVDWTKTMYVGLGGMANVTLRGDAYYVKHTSRECKEVFGSSCQQCEDATLQVIVFTAISIGVVIPAFFLDLHRIFKYFDLNLSKTLAVTLHLVFGTIFTVLLFAAFLTKCYLQLPRYAVHKGEGKRNVGLYVVWELAGISYAALALLILRPIPGILHCLVPTPSWANNKGLKAARNRRMDQSKVLDPFDPFAGSMMRNPIESKFKLEQPEYAIPIRQQSLATTIEADKEESFQGKFSDMISDDGFEESPQGPKGPRPTMRRKDGQDADDDDEEEVVIAEAVAPAKRHFASPEPPANPRGVHKEDAGGKSSRTVSPTPNDGQEERVDDVHEKPSISRDCTVDDEELKDIDFGASGSQLDGAPSRQESTLPAAESGDLPRSESEVTRTSSGKSGGKKKRTKKQKNGASSS